MSARDRELETECLNGLAALLGQTQALLDADSPLPSSATLHRVGCLMKEALLLRARAEGLALARELGAVRIELGPHG
jgi:hypothetical protein